MRIRSYQDSDFQAVIDLWNEVLPPTSPHNDPALSIQKKLAVERDLFFVADTEGQVVGTVMGGYDGHRGWIYSVAVLPAFRRQQIGTTLLQHLESALRERDCLKVNLQVRGTNAAVVAFYERLGFAVEEIISLGKRLY